jgi:PAS domain S-box-containing protein
MESCQQMSEQSEQSFRQLFMHSPLPKWVYSFKTLKFLEVNDAAILKYGYSRAEFLSMTIKDVRPAEDFKNLQNFLKQFPKDPRPVRRGLHRCKNGQILEVENVTSDIVFEGETARLVVIIDNTERNKAERQTQRIFETSQDLIHVTDSFGTFVQVSPSSSRVLGYPLEEVLGQSAQQFIHPDDIEHTRDCMRVARKKGTGIEFKSRYIHKDGHFVPILWTGVWSEKDHQYFFIGRDKTESDRTEEQLRQAQKMESMGQLTGGVAHDFNNILMVILSNVEMVQDEENVDPWVLKRIGSIEKAAGRAVALTRQLLAFSRKQALRPQRSDINELAVATCGMLRRTLGEQIEIDSVLADDLWPVRIDRTQFETALVNICINARDAMPDGGRILIETANILLDEDYVTQNPDAVPGRYVMCAVRDAGTGIDAKTIAKVFEPFFTTKGVGKGTGLGLSMVYGFIKQSLGYIKIDSEVGVGTMIKLYLPRDDSEAVAEPVETRMIMQRGSERILLVEDDAQVRTGVLHQLQSLGYSVVESANGEEGLAACETTEKPFDLLLTDVVMPGRINGKVLADEVARRWPPTRVLFMSGYTESAFANSGLDADIQLLTKPFRKSDLAQAIRRVLDERQ